MNIEMTNIISGLSRQEIEQQMVAATGIAVLAFTWLILSLKKVPINPDLGIPISKRLKSGFGVNESKIAKMFLYGVPAAFFTMGVIWLMMRSIPDEIVEDSQINQADTTCIGITPADEGRQALEIFTSLGIPIDPESPFLIANKTVSGDYNIENEDILSQAMLCGINE